MPYQRDLAAASSSSPHRRRRAPLECGRSPPKAATNTRLRQRGQLAGSARKPRAALPLHEQRSHHGRCVSRRAVCSSRTNGATHARPPRYPREGEGRSWPVPLRVSRLLPKVRIPEPLTARLADQRARGRCFPVVAGHAEGACWQPDSRVACKRPSLSLTRHSSHRRRRRTRSWCGRAPARRPDRSRLPHRRGPRRIAASTEAAVS
jgi:hypothetical protein